MIARTTIIVVAVSSWHSSAVGGIISDAGFFTGLSHTFVNFETRSGGASVTLGSGSSQAMPSTEYQSLGVLIGPGATWTNDAGSSFDQAQAIGGSPTIALSAGGAAFSIQFTSPVQAMGLFVMQNKNGATATLTAFDASNKLIQTVTLSGETIDGTVGVANYGFLGFVSSVGIARVSVAASPSLYDNLYFSSVPSPGAVGLVAGAGLVSARRRRSA